MKVIYVMWIKNHKKKLIIIGIVMVSPRQSPKLTMGQPSSRKAEKTTMQYNLVWGINLSMLHKMTNQLIMALV